MTRPGARVTLGKFPQEAIALRPAPSPLIFLHIPKAGGTTLQDIVVRQYRAGKGFRFTGDLNQLAQFEAMPQEERDGFDVLLGHVHFGLHERLSRPALYMTMLRDPVDRIVSHYYFVKARKEHYLHKAIIEKGMSLKEYAEKRACIEVDNDQVRWLCARPHKAVPIGKVSREMVEEAKWNLAHSISVVGLVERFEESLCCFGRAFGWADVSYGGRKNVTPDRPPLEEISEEAIRTIREVNRYDVELYGLARALFEEQMLRLGVLPGSVPEWQGTAQPELAGA